ncbi:metal ABC transporter permease [Oceanobacillus jeddahense]|uniref:Metal ABC transporter permease n=1 Tax=Oceanobacillus jeddahense TaxID=1462527 RepID=A0ABY5JSX2_9BACI|nr:metal ABC transporter permease [Oceanobacillus jeddahense]UUI01987.1 metal ABC transporter permease [Oceanobacillus jeddahense]
MLLDFLTYPFLRYTFLTGILIGIIAPLLGTFIVVRRQSLIADALSHVTLAGISFGLMAEKIYGWVISPIYSGMIFSVIGSIFIEKLRTVYKAYQEISIPIILSAGVGLSVIFISIADGFNTDLFNYLFGSVSAVTVNDFYVIFGVAAFVLFIIWLFFKELFTMSFDEEQATIAGLHVKWINMLFIVLTALVIAASIRIVGVLLVSALMTLPVAASMRIAKGFKQMIFLSILFGEIAVVFGIISGYYLDIPPGGTIVMTSLVLLLIAIGMKKLRK